MPTTFAIYVRPGASRPGLDGAHDGRPIVKVAAPPADGRANREVIATLARLFDVPPSALSVAAGHTSRRKLIRLDDDRLSPGALAAIERVWAQVLDELGIAAAPPAG